jgi:hypothetical protein
MLTSTFAMKRRMKMKITRLTCLLALCTVCATAVAGPTFQPLAELPLVGGEYAYRVSENEAVVGDLLIERITVGGNYIALMYRNRLGKALSAKFTICFYNRYGFLMCEKDVKGIAVGEGDVGAERVFVQSVPMHRLLERTGIVEPTGWAEVNWVVISDTNTHETDANKPNGE